MGEAIGGVSAPESVPVSAGGAEELAGKAVSAPRWLLIKSIILSGGTLINFLNC